MGQGLAWGSVTALLALALIGSGCSGNDAPAAGGDGGGGDATGSSSGGSGSGGSASGGSSGGSGSGGGSGGGSGSSSGASSSSSGSGGSSGSGPACPTTKCTTGQSCCTNFDAGAVACSSSCPPSDTVGCFGPADCGGSMPDCCGTLVVDGGQVPNCTGVSLTTQCVPKCTSNITLSCMTTDTMHVCTQPSDCGDDPANPNCCQIHGYYVCVPNLYKGALTCK